MSMILTWVEQHGAAVQAGAAAVQALAALVTVAVIVVLVRVTTRYVRLTESLTGAAIAEEQHRQTSALARRAELVEIVDRLRQAVQSLPGRDIPPAPPWTEDDIANLACLTTVVQPDRALEIARVVGDLRWLGDRVRDVQRTSRLTGLDWSAKGFPREEWTQRLANARAVLDAFVVSVSGT